MGSRALAPIGVLAFAIGGCWGPTPVTRSGRVIGPDGMPLAGVTVSAQDGSAVSDAAGNWSLATREDRLQFRKPGFEPATLPATTRTPRLQSTGRPIEVAWDERWNSPATEGVRAWLGTQGVSVKAVAKDQKLFPADVIVLASPAFSSYEALADLRAAARQGATLLLAGEWGGYPAVDLATLNEVASTAGIRFEGSLVRDPAATGSSDRIAPSFPWQPKGQSEPATFAGTGALSAVPPAVILASSGPASYRVSSWSHGPQIVAAYGPLGSGKVLAVADSSWLTDATSLGGSKPNWQVGGNSALALALVRF